MEPERAVALDHVIVQMSRRPREEFSGHEAFREWGSCFPVRFFLSLISLCPECVGGGDAVGSSMF